MPMKKKHKAALPFQPLLKEPFTKYLGRRFDAPGSFWPDHRPAEKNVIFHLQVTDFMEDVSSSSSSSSTPQINPNKIKFKACLLNDDDKNLTRPDMKVFSCWQWIG